MKVIVGLGNPGEEYAKTRHNVGFGVVDELLQKIFNSQFSISNQLSNVKFQMNSKFGAETAQVGEVMLVKPQTYMNKSGEAVVKIMQFYKLPPDNLWVVHDDLDIRLGEYKIQLGKGPKVHNGVNSLEKALGMSEFWRVRVGIDNRNQLPVTSNQKISGEEYVLMPFASQEKLVIHEVIEKAVDELVSGCL